MWLIICSVIQSGPRTCKKKHKGDDNKKERWTGTTYAFDIDSKKIHILIEMLEEISEWRKKN